MTDIRVPKLNSNDTTYTLIEWLVAAGDPVRTGDVVATVETSKAAEDLVSAGHGVLHHLVAEGTDCAVGQVVGRVLPASVDHSSAVAAASAAAGAAAAAAAAAAADRAAGAAAGGAVAADDAAGPVITEPARRMMAERGIDLATVRALGRPLIRTADIEMLAPSVDAAARAGRVEPLPPVQRAVAAVVSSSHRSIPTGFVAIDVPVDAARRHARRLIRAERCLIGLPELVVAALGTVAERFPHCFGAYVDPGAVRLAERIDVGVTMDVGRGLHVPVVRDVAATPIADIAKVLMRFRLAAMRGGFRAGDLTGANVLLALHTDDDISIAVPIVLPGTVCALSLAGQQQVVRLDDDGTPVAHTVVRLGVAYDHRVVNGAEAVELLRAIREVLQYPDSEHA